MSGEGHGRQSGCVDSPMSDEQRSPLPPRAAGRTLNLPDDFAAAEAAGTPRALTAGLAAVGAGRRLALLYDGLPRLLGRTQRARSRSASCVAAA
jgi:hypothetical protein